MTERSEAEEHLRIIRSLMERAMIYRAISAPTALVGGLLSVLTGLAFNRLANDPEAPAVDPRFFVLCWIGVLLATLAANAFFIWRDAHRRGELFLSPGMRLAARAVAPSFFCGATLTVALILAWSAFALPLWWMLFYGLGLLATGHFAPKSIAILGWSFLAAGLAVLISAATAGNIAGIYQAGPGNLLMAMTFGLFHIIYAACTWPRGQRQDERGGMP